MSLQYEKLKQPLPCLWLVDRDRVCGLLFSSAKEFGAHLKSDHASGHASGCGLLTSVEDSCPKTGVSCGWRGCEQVVLCTTITDYLLHVLAHPYHSFLKHLGTQFQSKHKLPLCQYESTYSEVVQPLEVEPRCQWHGGDCGKTFEDVWGFYDHVRNHIISKDSGGVCLWKGCKFSGRDRNKVLEHCRTHLHEKVVACPSCGMHFANNTKFKDHLNRQSSPPTNSSDKDLSCTFCHKTFPNQRLLREHARKHVNTVKCPHCELTCQGPSRLMQHIRYRHEVSKAHQCPLCNKHYKTAQSLSVHIETHGGFRVMCHIPGCNYVAKTERHLRGHVTSVHDKPQLRNNFRCHICSCCFQLGHQLTVHLMKKHGFKLPPGHCRFRYILGKDGYKSLQTVRLDDENVYTPEVSTFTAISDDTLDISQLEDASSEDLVSHSDKDEDMSVFQCATPGKILETFNKDNDEDVSSASNLTSERLELYIEDNNADVSSARLQDITSSPGPSSNYSWIPDSPLPPESPATFGYSPSTPTFCSHSFQQSPLSPNSPNSHVLAGSTHIPVKIADAIRMLPDILLDDVKF